MQYEDDIGEMMRWIYDQLKNDRSSMCSEDFASKTMQPAWYKDFDRDRERLRKLREKAAI